MLNHLIEAQKLFQNWALFFNKIGSSIIVHDHRPADCICWDGCQQVQGQNIFGKLKSEGIIQEQLDQVHSPIGLEMGSETTEEIDISILGEIIKLSKEKKPMKVKQLNRQLE